MTRTRLSNRRPIECIEFEHLGKRGEVRAGFRLDEDQPAELFINFGKAGSDVEAAARDGGLLLSIAMQHGIDLKAFQLSITRLDDGKASSVIGAAIDAIVEVYFPVSGGA